MKFRGFISVDLNEHPKLIRFYDSLKQTNAPLKMVEVENIHLTMKFNIKPFTARFEGTGAFPNTNYMKVIWIGMKNGEPLKKIAEFLNEELQSIDFRKEKRGFSPHITLARVKGSRNKENIQQLLRENENTIFGEQLIDSIRLKKSVLSPKGPTYSVVKEMKFGGVEE
jgi:2'-5' RNA ligase